MKKFTFLILLMAGLTMQLMAQLSIDAASTDYTIDFDATVSGVNEGQYAGTGFNPSPSSGQLDSDAWATTGMSSGATTFGGTYESGDHARGSSSGAEGTGGFWAFDIGSSDYIFGIQPGGSDWTPGTVTLKITNNTGSTITSLDIDYDIVVYNDQGRANSLNFSHSADDVIYTSVVALDFTTPEAADGSPTWQTTNRTTTITGLSIADGSNYYIRWEGNDVSGGGSRDEYGFHNIVVNASTGAANSADSDIVKKSAWSEPTDIDYLQYSASSGLTTTNSIEVGKFTIRDGGTTGSDSDSKPTGLISVTLSIGNFDNIQALALFDGTSNVSEVTSVTASTTFSGISGLSAADDATKDFSINATFKTNVTDNDNLKFTIISASADASGSTFAAGDAGGAETDDTGDNNKLVVTADRLSMNTPSTVVINTDFSASVDATDANGSIDLDETSSVTLAKASGTGTLSSLTGLTQPLSAGEFAWTDVQYDVAEDFTIEAQSATLTNATSGIITAQASANIDLIISEVTDPSDTYQNKFVEIYNAGTSSVDFNSITWYLSRQANGSPTSWADIQLTGTIAAGGKYVVAFNQTYFSGAYGFEADQYSGSVSGNGDDGYFLYYNGNHSTGTLIDAYGVIDQDGTLFPWKYENRKAVRLRSVTAPNTTWTASEWDIPGSAATDDMTPNEHKEDVTWAGTTDTDWNSKGNNWSGTWGYIPDASFNVTVPDVSNDPVISDHSVCNDLTLQDASSLDVNVGGSLTVYGGLYMPSSKSPETLADFTIKSDATGNGSVIITTVGSNGDYVTVERYIPAYTGSDDGWHTIASPVDNMTITGSNFYPGTNDDLYKWDESNNIWENYKAGWGDDNLYATEGYLVAYETSATKNFYGLLTNWDWDLFPLSYTPTEGNGWNLLGNPFPSAIEWGTADWALTNVGGVAQIWNDAGGNYISRNAGDIIPSTNGFFVQVSSATNSMTIPTSARVHNTTNNYKSSRVEEMDETLLLTITNEENTYYDVNRIGFRNDATEEWDIAFDAHKMFGSSTAPQLWTVSNDEIFSQNYLPYVYESYQLPLNFRAGVNSTYHLNFEGVESFFPNSEIHLEDVLLDKIIDLREQQLYDFMASTDDSEDRFILHFYGVTTTGDKPELNDTRIFSQHNTIYIQSGQMPKDAYRIEVFNVMGQTVYAERMEPTTLGSFTLNEKTGVYVVRVYGDKQTIVQKVMIK